MKETVTSMDVYQAGKRFWTEQINDFHNTASHLFPPVKTTLTVEDAVTVSIDQELAAKLLRVSNQNDLLLYVLMLSAMDILVFRYMESRDVTIGSPAYTRSGHDHIFNDWILLRTQIPGGASARQLLDINRKCVMEAYQNQHYPLNNVISSLGPDEYREFFPRIMLSLSSIHSLESAGSLSTIKDNQIFFLVKRIDSSLEFSLRYDSQAFESGQIENAARHFLTICGDLASGLEKNVEDVKFHSPQDMEKLLSVWNDTECRFEQAPTIHAAFESAARQFPSAIAVVRGNESITYRELDIKADGLAAKLRESMHGLAPLSRLVGIYLEPSIELVIGVLATLKAGTAFVPISRQQPDARIQYILEESRIQILLADDDIAERFCYGGLTILANKSYTAPDAPGDGETVQGGDLAYVIYTSGSTGTPKGVLVEHRGILNSSVWRIRTYELDSDDRMLNLISYAFDGFYSLLFSVLLSGGRAVLLDHADRLDPDRINRLIEDASITNIALIPSMYQILLDTASSAQFTSLRFALLAAESTSADLIARSRMLAPHVMLVNEYGPTENSVVSLAHFNMDASNPSIVGKPISNTQAYILGQDLSLLPIGVTGEICLSGIGLARGYLNRTDLTDKKFVPHPFRTNERLYRTGDLGRYRSDGCIEFCGRTDNQIKIRGHRVEAGEVERCIEGLPGIRRAIVVPYQKNLAAYYVPLQNGMDESAIRSRIEAFLPLYMVPAYFVALNEFPLTATGKVDLGALPPPGIVHPSPEGHGVPANKTEQLLANIWESLLGRQGIATDDNFFDIGGDSIKALQVIAIIRQKGYECSIHSLFANPSIRGFSKHLKEGVREISQASVSGSVRLTPIQKWLLEQKFDRIHHFNQSVMLFHEDGFEAGILGEVFAGLVEHHDALRMIYREESNVPEQINLGTDHQAFTLLEIDLRALPPAEAKDRIAQETGQLQRSINLAAGPLVKLGLFKTASGDHLLIVIHHLVVDGYSWRIFLEDFNTAYRQVVQKTPVELPPRTSSFQEWAERLEQYARSEPASAQAGYWSKSIALMQQKCPEVSTAGSTYLNLASAKCSLKAGTVSLLIEAASKSFDTNVETLLLTALGLAYRKWKRQDCIALCVEGHGREELFDDVFLGRTVGWFTTQYPVMLQIPSDDCGLAITLTKAALDDVPGNGLGFGILKYLPDDLAHPDIRRFQSPRILFNYLGQFELGGSDEKSLFRLSDLSVGDEIHPDWEIPFDLSVGVSIASDEADIAIQYNRAVFSEEDIAGFSANYAAFLEGIAAEGLRHQSIRVTEGLSEAYVHREYYSRDRNEVPKLFFFPPKMSLGLSYFLLAQYVNNADLVAFDFIERSSRLSDYIQHITVLQKSGPYVLGGYSSAAMVFEVARTMREQNLPVSDIILLDAKPGDAIGKATVSDLRTTESIGFFLKSMKPFFEGFDEGFADTAQEKIRAYAQFINRTHNVSVVDATIHYIKSRDTVEEDIRLCQTLSTRQIRVYDGAGDHSFMLNGSAAHTNAAIISMIVAGIYGC